MVCMSLTANFPSQFKEQPNVIFESFVEKYAKHPHYRSPRGEKLHAQTWQTEAPLRMLLNNLDTEIAEHPDKLIVYGGRGQAARSPQALKEIIHALLHMKEDQSLLVQSGKPVGIMHTHSEAPRVLIANSNLVPHWAHWEHFDELAAKGLMMYGQMTAGSWIYIGTQGILQGTYETFAALAQKHFGGSLKGKLVISAGLGGMGGAQPLAVTLNEGVFLGADVDYSRLEKRLESGYLDYITKNFDEALAMAIKAKKEKRALSIGLLSDIGSMLEKLIEKGIVPDAATDQTSAHDPINGYIPSGMNMDEANRLRKSNPENYRNKSISSMACHIEFLLKMKNEGCIVFDYGNNLRHFAQEGGAKNAFAIPGFVPEYIRPLFCEGKGPFRWVALSGDPEDIYKTDEALAELFPENKRLIKWLQAAQEKVKFQGLPARICWLGLGERDRAGTLFNHMVAEGTLSAPIVIGRDHLDAGSVASPFRETEGMLDGSDAVADWPILNAMSHCSGGATWVSYHHGGGVGIGYSLHAGVVILADGTKRAERCIQRVLHNDPALGVIRHVDAGYTRAQQHAKENNLWNPSTYE